MRVLGLVVGVFLGCAGIAACSLNPQPLPPENLADDGGAGADDATIGSIPDAMKGVDASYGDAGNEDATTDASIDAPSDAPDASDSATEGGDL